MITAMFKKICCPKTCEMLKDELRQEQKVLQIRLEEKSTELRKLKANQVALKQTVAMGLLHETDLPVYCHICAYFNDKAYVPYLSSTAFHIHLTDLYQAVAAEADLESAIGQIAARLL